MTITVSQLRLIMPFAGSAADTFVDPLNAAMDKYGISASPDRQAAFIANLAHESNELRHLSENLNYSADALLRVFPKYFTEEEAARYARQPERIANRVYANRVGNGPESSGDGWLYRARGPLGITFWNNYRVCGDALGVDLVTNPELLLDPVYGSASAAWFFSSHGCNELADDENFCGVCGVINAGSATAPVHRINGYDTRLAYHVTAQEALK